jgi:hypothetical protein
MDAIKKAIAKASTPPSQLQPQQQTDPRAFTQRAHSFTMVDRLGVSNSNLNNKSSTDLRKLSLGKAASPPTLLPTSSNVSVHNTSSVVTPSSSSPSGSPSVSRAALSSSAPSSPQRPALSSGGSSFFTPASAAPSRPAPPATLSSNVAASNELVSNGDWREATTSDGKVYYFNTITKQTSWTKPSQASPTVSTSRTASEILQLEQQLLKVDEQLLQLQLMEESPAESTTSTEGEWREASTPDGKRYYFNSVTRQTSWIKP